MSAQPGRVIGAAPKIMEGVVADLVLLDPAAERTIDTTRRSNGVNEPLVGLTLQGAVRAAIVGGRLVRESMA
jgi:dihydroorotase-like cyclic amidohydrolase